MKTFYFNFVLILLFGQYILSNSIPVINPTQLNNSIETSLNDTEIDFKKIFKFDYDSIDEENLNNYDIEKEKIKDLIETEKNIKQENTYDIFTKEIASSQTEMVTEIMSEIITKKDIEIVPKTNYTFVSETITETVTETVPETNFTFITENFISEIVPENKEYTSEATSVFVSENGSNFISEVSLIPLFPNSTDDYKNAVQKIFNVISNKTENNYNSEEILELIQTIFNQTRIELETQETPFWGIFLKYGETIGIIFLIIIVGIVIGFLNKNRQYNKNKFLK